MKQLLLSLSFVTISFAGVKITYYAPVPPPPTVEEKHPVVHEPGSVWINGYWAYADGHHAWKAGHWELPPNPKAHYIQPHWSRKGDQYAFREGYWKLK